jgi:hypothetical protein
MKNVVYILGAGFSAPLNIPTMSQFMFTSRSLINLIQDTNELKQHKSALDILHRLYSTKSIADIDLYNIENVYSLICAQSLIDKNKSGNNGSEKEIFESFIKRVIRLSTPSFIDCRVKNDTALNHAKDHDTLEIYHVWGNLNPSNTQELYVQFFTSLLGPYLPGSSHDLGYINSAKQASSDTVYGFISFNYDRVFEECIKAICDSAFFNIDKKPVMLKLHGDVNGEIIPPSWDKNLKTYLPEWESAGQLLMNANEVRILGFSLPKSDVHVRLFLAACLSKCENLQNIDVICRDTSGEIKNIYLEYFKFPKIRLISSDIKQYLESFRTCRLFSNGMKKSAEDNHHNYFP